MQLHEVVHELVQQHGAVALSDAGGFRAGLEDYLGDSPVRQGDLNLLADAVRYGAVTRLLELLDHRAAPDHAVWDAGRLLAEERGGADHQASAWACAVLGYALDRVPLDVVLRLRSTPLPAPSPPPDPPARRPVPPPAPGPEPAWEPPYPPAPPPATRPAWSPASSAPAAPAPRRSRGRVLLVSGLVAVLVIGLGLGATVVLTRDQGAGGSAGSLAGSGSGGDRPIDPEEVADRYAALATGFGTRARECEVDALGPDDESAGVTEVVHCELGEGRLQLQTYGSESDLDEERSAVVDTREGTIADTDPDGHYYSYDPRRGSGGSARIYWDDRAALQAATITANPGTGAKGVQRELDELGTTVDPPTRPSDPGLIEFYETYEVSGCERVATYTPGETEESVCDIRDVPDGWAYAGKFGEASDLRRYRREATRSQRQQGAFESLLIYDDADGDNQRDAGEGRLGAVRGYLSDDTAVLYLDDVRCRCYLEVYGPNVPGESDLEGLHSAVFEPSGG